MTAQRSGSVAARAWEGVRDLSNRMSLRTKLITGLLALVIAAVAAISISSVWVLRSYLTSQDDRQVQATYNGLYTAIVDGLMPPDHIPIPGVTYSVGNFNNIVAGVQEPGTPLTPRSQSGLPYSGYAQALSVPAVPTSELWDITNSGKLVTVRAQSGSDTWRVKTGPISYQLPTSTGFQQVNGTLIVAPTSATSTRRSAGWPRPS
jgi:hypothetical protein